MRLLSSRWGHIVRKHWLHASGVLISIAAFYAISRWLVPPISTPQWDLVKWTILGVAGWVATRFWLPLVDDLIKRAVADRSSACRVLILGVSGVGKTSLIERWLT